MLKRSSVSRRLLAAAVLSSSALSLNTLSYAQTVLPASDDVSARPSQGNQNANQLYIKNASNQNNNASDTVGYIEFDFTPGAYPTGFRSAVLTVDATDQYFTSLTGTSPNIAVQKYTPEYHYNVYGLPDAHPNENFNETGLKSSGWSSGITADTAVNVGPNLANNTVGGVGDYYGVFRDGFTIDPRPAPRTGAGYTNPEPTWAGITLAGTGSVRDSYRNDPDLNTYSYTSTSANGTFLSATPDGVPDNSQTDISGNAENDLTVDLAEWINANDQNNIATFVVKRVEEADGGASFFARTPTLTVTPGLPVHWDIDGNNPGAGGAAPSGVWDGTATNFNIDSAGAGTPSDITPLVTSADTAVFGAGGDATGTYTVTLSGTRKAYQVNIEDGNVTLTGGTLSTRAVDVAAGATATIASAVTGGPTGSFTKKGAGTLTLTAANTYTGGTNVQAGTLEVKRMHENNAVNITGGTLRIIESSPGVSSGHPSGDDASVSRPSSLSIAAGAQLDITNNDVIIDYSGASPLATYEALVASGYNVVGDWQGDGIVSSIAANDGNYVVAIADNATLAAPFGTAQGGALFAGQDVDLDTVLIKFTHRADINLDGVITPDDSAIFGGNYDENQPAVWATGDMNYDGIFTPDDAAIFGGAYDESLASLPEPGSLAALGLLGLALARRRR